MEGMVRFFQTLLAGEAIALDGLTIYERESRRNTIACLGAFAVFNLLLCLIIGGNIGWKQARLAREGINTPGTITILSHHENSYSGAYQYEVNGKILSDKFGPVYGKEVRLADSIPVRYLPSEPLENEIPGRNNFLIPYILVATYGIFALLLLVRFWNQWQLFHASVPLTMIPEIEETPKVAPKPSPITPTANKVVAPTRPKTERVYRITTDEDISLNELPQKTETKRVYRITTENDNLLNELPTDKNR